MPIYRPQLIKQVPGQIVGINKKNPISRGLIGCWVPGKSFINLGITTDLTLGYGTGPAGFKTTIEGPGVSSSGTGSELFTPALPPGSPFFFTNALTLYYRAIGSGLPQNLADYFGVIYDSAGSSPFYIAAVRDNSGAFEAMWNTNGVLGQFTTVVSDNITGVFSFAVSFVVNSNVTFYLNGISRGTAAFGATAPTNSATSFIDIGGYHSVNTRYSGATTLACYAWNRALSDAEILALDLAPYSLLNTFAAPVTKPTLVSAALFRKTLSPVGARIGARQSQGWAV